MNLADQHITEQGDEIAEQPGEIFPGLGLFLDERQGGGSIAGKQGLREAKDRLARRESEDALDVGGADRRAAEGDDLIEHRLGVAHRPVGTAGNGGGGSRIEGDVLALRDVEQVIGDELRREPAEIEALATAQDRGGNLLRLGRGEEELHVLGRLLERLEQGIEGRGAEHVHLID